MAGHDIVVIGTSSGGVEVLSRLMRGLPAGLPASLFIVCHIPPGYRSVLPEILSREGKLLAAHARDGEPFHPGHVYVAPPDYHLLLEAGGRMRLSHGPRENHHRPAIDPLFRSAARAFGPRVIGVVLSGSLDDGTAGLLAVRAAGGVAVVQDPADAAVAAMPQNASHIAGADHIVPSAELAPLLARLVHEAVPSTGDPDMSDPYERMPDAIRADMDEQVNGARRGRASLFCCPECGGTLWQVDAEQLVGFRCHVGHVYQAETLLAEQSAALEAALWTSVRTFKERNLLCRQMALRARQLGDEGTAARYQEQAEQALRYSDLIQRYVLAGPPPPGKTMENMGNVQPTAPPAREDGAPRSEPSADNRKDAQSPPGGAS